MKEWLVDDVMTRDVATVGESTIYRDIVTMLTDQRISAAPVVDDFRRVVGVVSEADLLYKVEMVGEGPPRMLDTREHRRARIKSIGTTAAELMSAPAITAFAGTTVHAAARRMDSERVKRLPVVDDLGRLVGVVTRGDLLKAFLRPDADIRAEVAQEVLRRVLVVDEGTVRVEVDDGVVTLIGQLDRKSAVDIAVRLTRQIAGVVDVVSRLTFDFDDSNLVGRSMTGRPLGVG
jgi:CBS-domain-containing membrane protein